MPFLLPPVKHTSSEGLNIAEILFFLCVLQQLLFTVPVEGSPVGDSLVAGDNPEEDSLAAEGSPEADRPEEAEQRIRRRTT